MAVHKCRTFRLKRKNLLSPIPDACCAMLALRSIQLMTGEPRPPVQRAPVTWREWGLLGMTNTNPVIDHEAAIINSSFSEWLLSVIVFTNLAIDIAKDITTGICVVIAIIGTFIKNKKILVDKVNYDMVNKVCGCGQSISIVTIYRKPVTVRKSPPTPEAVISTARAAAIMQMIMNGWNIKLAKRGTIQVTMVLLSGKFSYSEMNRTVITHITPSIVWTIKFHSCYIICIYLCNQD